MKISISFESEHTCKQRWENATDKSLRYQNQKTALTDWNQAHRIRCHVIPFINLVLMTVLVFMFTFHTLPSIFHHYYDSGDFDTGFMSLIMAVICFPLGTLLAVKLLRILLRKLNLEGPSVEESPRWGKSELKYERYAIIQPLLTSEKNTPIAIAVVASFGFKSVRNQDTSADPDCIVLDFDRELILIPTQEPDELDP